MSSPACAHTQTAAHNKARFDRPPSSSRSKKRGRQPTEAREGPRRPLALAVRPPLVCLLLLLGQPLEQLVVHTIEALRVARAVKCVWPPVASQPSSLLGCTVHDDARAAAAPQHTCSPQGAAPTAQRSPSTAHPRAIAKAGEAGGGEVCIQVDLVIGALPPAEPGAAARLVPLPRAQDGVLVAVVPGGLKCTAQHSAAGHCWHFCGEGCGKQGLSCTTR